jgi:Fur family ferric uptake transcriptional regulator
MRPTPTIALVSTARDIFLEHLRHRGLKVTLPRLRILETVLARESFHFTADDLARLVNESGRQKVSRSTVYRTLDLLEECGIVRRERMHEGYSCYEKAVGTGHHDHMICGECGRIIEFHSRELEQVQDSVCREHGFRPRRHALHIFGLCRECAGKKKTG